MINKINSIKKKQNNGYAWTGKNDRGPYHKKDTSQGARR